METFEEYQENYNLTGRIPNEISPRKNKLNEVQLKSKYKKYCAKKEQNNLLISEETGYTIKVDLQWDNLKDQLDLENCQLIKRLKEEKMDSAIGLLKTNAQWLIKTIDPAHIFPRSGYPFMKYDVDNVVPLNRFSHSCLDTMRDPISGENITKEEQQTFWMFIAGKEVYKELEERSFNKRKF